MIHHGLTEELYNQLEGIRSSHLKHALKSQAHYLHALKNPPKDTDAMKLGRYIHMAILEPTRFKETCFVMPDFGDMRSKANREKRDAFLADGPQGRIFLTEEESAIITGICGTLLKKKSFQKIIEENNLEKEVSFQGMVNGIKTKCRADAVDIKRRVLIDIKSCQSATPEAMSFYIRDYAVDVQQSFYVATMESAIGNEAFSFEEWTSYIVAVEKTGPFECQVFELPTQELACAFKDVSIALEQIKEASTNEYRGYPDFILPLSRYRTFNESLDLKIGG